jgi:fatty acid desaturase
MSAPAMPVDVATPSTNRGSDYAELSRRIKQAGLLERRHAYYVVRIAVTAALFVLGWTAFAVLGDSWWQLAVAAFLAVIFAQVGFLGHDAGHRQVFRSRRANEVLGLIGGNLGIGLSFGWWVDKHNRHHAHPNHEGRDPDIAIGPLVFTPNDARRRRGIAKALARAQSFFFVPLLLLEAINLHVASVAALRRRVRHRPWEVGLIALHFAGYLTAVFLVLSPWQAVAFLAVHQGLLGLYLGCSFAPNHKGMPVLTGDDELDFLRRQVLTSRNVRGGRLLDSLLGALNYQIEHHLFPSMPRPNLRRAQPIVRAFCAEYGVPYLETTLGASYAQALRYLHVVTRTPA